MQEKWSLQTGGLFNKVHQNVPIFQGYVEYSENGDLVDLSRSSFLNVELTSFCQFSIYVSCAGLVCQCLKVIFYIIFLNSSNANATRIQLFTAVPTERRWVTSQHKDNNVRAQLVVSPSVTCTIKIKEMPVTWGCGNIVAVGLPEAELHHEESVGIRGPLQFLFPLCTWELSCRIES